MFKKLLALALVAIMALSAVGALAQSSAPAWAEYDELIKQIKTATDLKEREALMHKAEDMLMKTYAVVPLYYYNDLYMQKSNVEGIYANLFQTKFFAYATKTGAFNSATKNLTITAAVAPSTSSARSSRVLKMKRTPGWSSRTITSP